ncbi:hypothetical protein MHL40_22120, partial [Pseudomonas luteola]|uniref:hypothetical protein n=1 Tax=Pseudomonas luteola TaxID=47886 RepID=UPI001EF6619B
FLLFYILSGTPRLAGIIFKAGLRPWFVHSPLRLKKRKGGCGQYHGLHRLEGLLEYSNWGPSLLGLLCSLEGAPFQSLCADEFR